MSNFDENIVRECVGCGFCCRKAPCCVSLRVHGPVTACPSLVYRDERYFCGLCELPGALGERYREELYVGAGCCCGLNTDRQSIPRPTEPLPKRIMDRQMRVFLHHLCRSFVSGDMLWLTINSASSELGKGWMEEALRVISEERSQHMKDFMG